MRATGWQRYYGIAPCSADADAATSKITTVGAAPTIITLVGLHESVVTTHAKKPAAYFCMNGQALKMAAADDTP